MTSVQNNVWRKGENFFSSEQFLQKTLLKWHIFEHFDAVDRIVAKRLDELEYFGWVGYRKKNSGNKTGKIEGILQVKIAYITTSITLVSLLVKDSFEAFIIGLSYLQSTYCCFKGCTRSIV
ncbi:uncharacterized protein VTP21DRAFT_3207 [Calcarisporiella thermophila]|uniref:uncharacterized protein n=1 Tax=Calcarisporiella thermophila TaxID=911321 RepID=UPI0037424C68